MMSENESRGSVCLVTCRRLPQLTADDMPLAEAFERRGFAVEVAAWDDPRDWASHEAVIIRSTWDYHHRAEEFRGWLEACERGGVRLWNPPALVRWNMHKAYLLELRAAGLPVVPTELLRRGEPHRLAEVLGRRGWAEAVVKPAISATAYRTFRAAAGTAEAQQGELEALVADSDALVQPFVPEIVSAGEISFLYFGGSFGHAVLKQAKEGDFRVQSDFGGHETLIEPSAALLEQADLIAAEIPQPWLYARIDVVERAGVLQVMEIELIEPQLFFAQHPSSAVMLVEALERKLAQS